MATNQYENLTEQFRHLSNPEKATQMAAYMRNQFEFFGIQAAPRKAAYKDILYEAKRLKTIDWELLDKCWNDKHREFQYFVADYLATMQPVLTYEDVVKIEKYIRSKQWWDTIDGLDRIVGNIAFRDKRINTLMLEWSTDSNFWVRRVAIDHQLLKKDKTNTELLEKIIVNNFGSSEFFINKAIGWSLRDYSKTNPDWVRKFIERYRNQMKPLSIREASKFI